MRTPICFKTERLLLRPTSVKDAAFLKQLMNTPGWLQFIGDRGIYTLKSACQYIQERIEPQYEQLGYGAYTLVLLQGGEKIGICGLYDREGIDGVDIGFALLPEYEKQGFAWEAARCLREMAFELFGLKKISGITTAKNVASRRLLEKLGLTYQKVVQLPNENKPLLLFELSIADFTAQNTAANEDYSVD